MLSRTSSVLPIGYYCPPSPVILALGFGLYVPNVLSLENVVNIIQQASFLFVLTGRTDHRVADSWTDLSLGPSVSMISVGSALTMTAVLGPNAANGVVAALAGTAVGLVLGLSSRPVQWGGCSMAPREPVCCYPRQHEYLPRYWHIALGRPSGIRHT